jgi:hypothetical protein
MSSLFRAALLGLALGLAAFVAPARADMRRDLAAGQPLPPLAELVVRGVNHGKAPHTLVLRVDDRAVPDYADRANVERMVPPGPFVLRLRLATLRTPRGRILDLGQLRQVIGFSPVSDVALSAIGVETPPALPEGVYGWAFAPQGAAPLAGFDVVSIGDARIGGPNPRAVARPSEDPVLANGVTGVTRFATPLPAGRWRIALWTEDPGEWETLPPVVEQRIRVNGKDLLMLRRSAAAWIRDRYMAGRDIEAGAADAPWLSLGARRGGLVEGEVEIGAGGLVVELAGHPHAATHLAAIVAEPADGPRRAVAAVEAVREARFAEAWPVLGKPAAVRGARLDLSVETPVVDAAPGGLAVVRLSARAAVAGPADVELSWQGSPLPVQVLWGNWRWRRPTPETPGVALSAAHLRADTGALTLRPDLPRPLVLVVRVPADAKAGRHGMSVRLTQGAGVVSRAAAIQVLAVSRPQPAARVGVFLDVAPHLMALPETVPHARKQAACDLETLAGLGMTAVSPPLATPDAEGMDEFLADLRAANRAFPAPPLAYSAARRLAGKLGDNAAAAAMAQAEQRARAAGLPAPVWTIADEPSANGTAEIAHALAQAARLANRNTRLAAHLNNPADTRILRDFDLVTVNQAYGADRADIQRVRALGPEVWLYNMPRLRIAAGFYLWRSGAAGLLQWHARMPTADAFDPTDGREGDVQFLWPTEEVCGPADLDADLLEIAEGAEDLRWLAWLEQEARHNSQAAALLETLRQEIPERWADAMALEPGALAAWRGRIVEIARRLTR